ncbi:hypothetical protein SprV_0501889100 [Sparganum proliferum]
MLVCLRAFVAIGLQSCFTLRIKQGGSMQAEATVHDQNNLVVTSAEGSFTEFVTIPLAAKALITLKRKTSPIRLVSTKIKL